VKLVRKPPERSGEVELELVHRRPAEIDPLVGFYRGLEPGDRAVAAAPRARRDVQAAAALADEVEGVRGCDEPHAAG
jgi:hypothetical protein